MPNGTKGLLLVLFVVGALATSGVELAPTTDPSADGLIAGQSGGKVGPFKEMSVTFASTTSKTAVAAEGQTTLAAQEPQASASVGSMSAMREASTIGLPEASAFKATMPIAPPIGGGVSGSVFEIGDKLKIAFYEHLDLQDDKWVRTRPPRPGLQQRVELTGEYTVAVDGSISLPLFGIIPAAGRSSQELQAKLEGMFAELTGRRGFVTAVVLERQPIYVLGPVRNPGSYKYAAGMTVFHAVALAGGLDRATLGTWQEVEGVRAIEKQRGSTAHLIRLLARDAVLKAERDGTPLKASDRLIELAGETRAKSALNLEIDRRDVTVMSNRARESTLSLAIENAKQEIETLSNRVPTLDANVQLRDDRLSRMRALASRNVVTSVVVDQAQGDLLSVQERRQEAFGSITNAKQRLNLAEQEKIRHQTEVKTELEQAIERVEQEIADMERDLASSRGVLQVINMAGLHSSTVPTEDSIAYEIVRHAPGGSTMILKATGTTNLEPGDLVRLHTSGEYQQRVPGVLPETRVTEQD
jgi:protein involved in polysaccharide export with SLBB domain